MSSIKQQRDGNRLDEMGWGGGSSTDAATQPTQRVFQRTLVNDDEYDADGGDGAGDGVRIVALRWNGGARGREPGHLCALRTEAESAAVS